MVTKSLAPFAWAGNPAPRLHAAPAGMVNAVGLQGAGVAAWLADDLPAARRRGRRASWRRIWGRTVDDYAEAALLLADAPAAVIAVEVNLSCPNLGGRGHVRPLDPTPPHDAVAATAACRRPRWAKLSPTWPTSSSIAAAATAGGAEAVTLVNTLLGHGHRRRRGAAPASAPAAGACPGRPSTLSRCGRCTTCTPPCRELAIVGVGGVTGATTALELVLAGASAVQIGTATFADRARRRRHPRRRGPLVRRTDGVDRFSGSHRRCPWNP